MNVFRIPSLLVAVLITACAAAELKAAEWTNLIRGNTLDGWVQRNGKAPYRVENGEIIGTTLKGQPNSFLCTDRDYGDFILEVEYLVDPRMNSGIQIRSESKPDVRNGRVHGYQVEIDPSNRAWSGGIYDEARRGWLNPLTGNEAAQKAFRQNEWNHYRVEAIGDSIKTWINGVPAADLRDSMTVEGFIALQVHSTNRDEPMEIRWRNIRIQDLGRHVWKPIFDGETLNGWHTLPGGEWKVEDDMIVGRSPASDARHGLLVTDRKYSDFTARLKFRVHSGDSGFYFRVDEVGGTVGVNGFQVEVDSSLETGGLYETGGRAWVVKTKDEDNAKIYKPGEWTDLSLSAHGSRLTVQLNGRKTAELLDDPGRREGHLALQLHGSQDMHVEYKDIEVLVKAE